MFQHSFKKILKGILFFVFLGALGSFYLYGEQPKGVYEGVVLDRDTKKPLANANIVLHKYPSSYQSTSNEKGEFKVLAPVGRYYPQVKLKGYSLAYLSSIVLEEGKAKEPKEVFLRKLTPSLSLYLSNFTRTPRQKVWLKLTGAYISWVKFSLYQMDPLIYLKSSGKSLKELDYLSHFDKNTPGLQLLKEWEYGIPKEDQSEFDQKIWPEVPEKGLFLLVAQGEEAGRTKVHTKYEIINRTELGAVLKRDDEKLVVYVSHFQDLKPVADAEVWLLADRHLGPFQTDSYGSVTIPMGEVPHSLLKESIPIIVRKDAFWAYQYVSAPGAYFGDEEQTFSETRLNAQNEAVTKTYQSKVFLYSDRPVYRPGQLVHFKGIARYQDLSGEYVLPPENSNIEISVSDRNGDPLLEETYKTNASGSVWGELQLDEEPPLGIYSVQATFKGSEFYYEFSVEEYRKPEFKVDIQPEKEKYFSGDLVRVHLDSTYYFGSPAETKLQYVVYESDFYPWEEGDGEESYDGYGDVLSEGEISTDTKGHAVLEFKAKKLPSTKRYTVSVAATDSSNKEVNVEKSFVVFAADFKIMAFPDAFVYYAGEFIKFRFETKDLQDRPVSKSLNVQVEKQTFDPKDYGYHYEKEASFNIQTGSDGLKTHDFKISKGGYYRLTLSGEDDSGRKILSFAYVWVASRGYDDGFHLEKTLSLNCDKKKYEVGQVAKCVLVNPKPGLSVLISVEGLKLHRYWVEEVKGHSAVLEIPLEKGFIPNVFLTATTIGDKAYHEDFLELSIDPKEKFIDIEITSNKEAFEPGEEISYDIQLKDPTTGAPLQGEVSVGVVDESIYALREDDRSIKKFFWGNKENRVMTSHSFSGYLYAGFDKFDQDRARKNFKDTAFWTPFLPTNEEGRATVSFKLPDNLTTWRATVVAHNRDTFVGKTVQKVVASKDLMVRLATPRFYIQGDKGFLRAIVHNNTDNSQTVDLAYSLEGLRFTEAEKRTEQITIPPQDKVEVDYEVEATKLGEAKIGFQARNKKMADSMIWPVPVLPNGIEEHQYLKSRIPSGLEVSPSETEAGSKRLSVDLPLDTNPENVALTVNVDAHYLSTMMGGVDFLVAYPYGCVEQTMSRLLPSLVVSHIASDFQMMEPKLAMKLKQVIKKGVNRIYSMQHYDGGWGWWKSDANDPYMTAYAFYGLFMAKKWGYPVKESVLQKGKESLKKQFEISYDPTFGTKEDFQQTKLYMHYVLRLAGETMSLLDQGLVGDKGFLEKVYASLIFDLENRKPLSQQALDNALAQLNCDKGECYYEFVYQGTNYSYRYFAFREMALLLYAMAKTGYPETIKKDQLVKFLIQHREGDKWRTTLDTAHVLYAFAELAKSEVPKDNVMEMGINLNDEEVASISHRGMHTSKILTSPLWKVPHNQLTLKNRGDRPVYFSGDLKYFVRGGRLQASPHGIHIKREYFEWDIEKKEWRALKSGDSVSVGQHVLVQISTWMEKDGHKLIFEDPLPSGFEVVQDPDERTTGYLRYSNKEIRDEKVALFFNYYHYDAKHPEVIFSHTIRPERPGIFHVMPTSGYAMYQPEIRGTGDEFVIKVRQ